jgi:prepilin-type N-terminal cleavage/methylation domain-containing protein
MPTSSVGTTSRSSREAGVTLVELLIVVALIGLLAAITYPSAAAGIDSMRLRGASNETVSFLNIALERALRHQQVVEIRISPGENAMIARTADGVFVREASIAEPVRILSVRPIPPGADPRVLRRFLIYPGGSVPRIAIELGTSSGRRKLVSVDPVTLTPRSENE